MSDSGATDPKTGRHAVVAAVGSRYHIQAKVGTGAFADVYEAHDAVLDRTVAIKQFRLDSFAYPSKIEDLKKRILREAQVAAQLHHSNIVTTHDIILTDERCVIVMEFVDGVTLEAIVEKHSRLGLPDTINILSQVAEALDHAHAHKVVHRDVKPANVMVSRSGEVKVTDFGIAKTETSTNLTASGSILGTPDYMSPEQARAEHVDGRSDLFSLGCILYECLSGRKPFRGDGLTGVLLQIVNEEPEPLDCETLGLPVAVQAVLKNALAKDPLKRFASGREFALALQSIPAIDPDEPSKIFLDGESAEESKSKLSTKETTPILDDSVADSLMKEARRTTRIEPHLRVLLEEDRRLRLVSSPLLHFHNVSLTPEEAFILSRIDRTVAPRDVFKVSALSEKDTARTLLGLLRAGIIELGGATYRQESSPGSQTGRRLGPCSRTAPPRNRAALRALSATGRLASARGRPGSDARRNQEGVSKENLSISPGPLFRDRRPGVSQKAIFPLHSGQRGLCNAFKPNSRKRGKRPRYEDSVHHEQDRKSRSCELYLRERQRCVRGRGLLAGDLALPRSYRSR